MGQFDRISVDPGIMEGQPCIRGTRLTVRRVLLIFANYKDREEIRKDYPQLQDADLHQALEYAAANLQDQTLELPAAK